MRRRDFLAMTSAVAVTLVGVPAWAQQRPVPGAPGGRPWLIAFLVTQTKVQSDRDSLGPFLKGMQELGYVEGRDFVVEARYADGDITRVPALAKQLVDLQPDLIVGDGNGVPAAAAATTTIPIVGGINPSTLEAQVGNNLARPSGNVTGIATSNPLLTAKHCDLALELVPGAARIGILVSTGADASITRQQVAAASEARKFTPVLIDVAQPENIAGAFRLLADSRVEVVVVGAGGVFAADRPRTAAAAAAAGLPAIYNEQGYVEAGGLICYGFDRRANNERYARYANLILTGAKIADLPVEQTSNFLMAINLKTAKSLGLTIPPSILLRADLVIE
jgi:putative ABC transport system substrate-binding protein